ncbi:winged helix-turn-helix transcriptional regulator [Mesorhizobium delmotii]|uniref:Transcriptional regulator n=1 Tax=Mesorhizobium delmotii TaxID=1631247 RepID=A0A2P9AJ32_9HYPH|nr:helix-turn-helix domain-containing protein [Mesorhizobium delmotii]SJM31147.1 Transcriptional regulator [Mesorhizobium delmotii]
MAKPTKRGSTKRLPTKRLPMLPAERALKVISGRWKAVILYHLFDGPRRLSVLKTLVPDITQKVLIQQLREMEEHGLIRREIFAEIPSRVEYSATRLGLSLEPILLALCEWGQHHADELNEMDRVTDCIIRPRQARPPAIA